MFGPIMNFKTKTGLDIELGPISRELLGEFIKQGGMQSYEVLKYLSRGGAAVLEDEYDWFDKTRHDKEDLIWGIYIVDGDKKTLIGTSGLHEINGKMYSPCRSATSGFIIFRQEFWGKGIAGACHRARTMYAFDMLGIVVIRSGVIFQNEASRRAVESVGYVVHHTDRMGDLIMGEPRNDYTLLCINPDKYVWGYWWRGAKPSKKWLDARAKTTESLKWARENVKLP